MKPKASGANHARLNARGYKQVDGLHYDCHDLSAPVVNDMTVRIVTILTIMAAWTAELLDVQGAFLNGQFQNGEQLYMYVPQGFERFYPLNVLLLLLRTIYGLKQAAMQFWRALLAAMLDIKFNQKRADP
eukprot:8659520-Ditylum_brightwellii.AAC.1